MVPFLSLHLPPSIITSRSLLLKPASQTLAHPFTGHAFPPASPCPPISLCQPVTLWTSPFIPWRLRLQVLSAPQPISCRHRDDASLTFRFVQFVGLSSREFLCRLYHPPLSHGHALGFFFLIKNLHLSNLKCKLSFSLWLQILTFPAHVHNHELKLQPDLQFFDSSDFLTLNFYSPLPLKVFVVVVCFVFLFWVPLTMLIHHYNPSLRKLTTHPSGVLMVIFALQHPP